MLDPRTGHKKINSTFNLFEGARAVGFFAAVVIRAHFDGPLSDLRRGDGKADIGVVNEQLS
jgi:hypothetical protein